MCAGAQTQTMSDTPTPLAQQSPEAVISSSVIQMQPNQAQQQQPPFQSLAPLQQQLANASGHPAPVAAPHIMSHPTPSAPDAKEPRQLQPKARPTDQTEDDAEFARALAASDVRRVTRSKRGGPSIAEAPPLRRPKQQAPPLPSLQQHLALLPSQAHLTAVLPQPANASQPSSSPLRSLEDNTSRFFTQGLNLLSQAVHTHGTDPNQWNNATMAWFMPLLQQVIVPACKLASSGAFQGPDMTQALTLMSQSHGLTWIQPTAAQGHQSTASASMSAGPGQLPLLPPPPSSLSSAAHQLPAQRLECLEQTAVQTSQKVPVPQPLAAPTSLPLFLPVLGSSDPCVGPLPAPHSSGVSASEAQPLQLPAALQAVRRVTLAGPKLPSQLLLHPPGPAGACVIPITDLPAPHSDPAHSPDKNAGPQPLLSEPVLNLAQSKSALGKNKIAVAVAQPNKKARLSNPVVEALAGRPGRAPLIRMGLDESENDSADEPDTRAWVSRAGEGTNTGSRSSRGATAGTGIGNTLSPAVAASTVGNTSIYADAYEPEEGGTEGRVKSKGQSDVGKTGGGSVAATQSKPWIQPVKSARAAAPGSTSTVAAPANIAPIADPITTQVSAAAAAVTVHALRASNPLAAAPRAGLAEYKPDRPRRQGTVTSYREATPDAAGAMADTAAPQASRAAIPVQEKDRAQRNVGPTAAGAAAVSRRAVKQEPAAGASKHVERAGKKPTHLVGRPHLDDKPRADWTDEDLLFFPWTVVYDEVSDFIKSTCA